MHDEHLKTQLLATIFYKQKTSNFNEFHSDKSSNSNLKSN